jgi:hypothetical protein
MPGTSPGMTVVFLVVMAGLDPAIHVFRARYFFRNSAFTQL